MYRIDAIRLTDTSPVGPLAIGAPVTPLSEFDLIVIEGSNGSGKTSLSEPLRSWSPQAQRKWCSTTEAEPTDLDPKVDIVSSLLARDSAELLGDFQSIDSALASAIGAQRRAAEADLLEKLVPAASRGEYRLANLVQSSAVERSHDVSSALENYMAAEQAAAAKIGSLPMTLGTYNELGRAAARDAGKAWTDLTQCDTSLMQAAESALQPRAESVPGYQELYGALNAVEFGIDPVQLSEAVERLTTAESELGSAMSAARDRLTDADEGASVDELSKACTARAKAERATADSWAEQAKALDAIEKLRADARDLIERTNPPACPVCDRHFTASEIVRRLSESATNGAAESLRRTEAKHRQQASDLDMHASRLSVAAENLKAATRRVLSTIKEMRDCLRTNMRSLDHHDTWSPWVNELAAKSCAAMQAVANQIEAAETSSNAAAAGRVVSDARIAGTTLRGIRVDADRRMDDNKKSAVAAEMALGKMSLLRRVLDARERLNALEWRSNWHQVHAAHAQAPRLQRWQAAIRSLIEDRRAQAAPLYDALLKNSDIERRFTGLLRAFRPHELLSDPALRPNGVTNGTMTVTKDQRAPSKLSEGYRAAVNLAAFIAVAGHQGPAQRHKAGWILIDEPTNGLDPQNRDRLADHLGALSMLDMPKQVFVTTFEPSFANRLTDAAKRAGHRRILRITLRDWSTRPANAPDLIRVN